MLLYIIRHGDADTPAPTDDDRELSKKGRKVTEAMGQLLKQAGFTPPELILASPLPRADQTARIIAEEFAPEAKFESNDGLKPSSRLESAMSLIASKKDECKVLMIVGHDPLFSVLGSALVCGSEVPTIEMKKSGVAVFEIFRFDVPRMRGVLKAFLPPKLAVGVA